MSNQNKETIRSGKTLPHKDIEKVVLPSVETFIPEEVKPILKRLNQNERQVILSALIEVKRTSWAGPMPPPDILAGYNDIIPDGAERILRMAEKQSDHRMDLEKTVIKRELNQSGRGQTYALVIVILVLIASVFLIYTGHEAAGGALGVVDLVGLAAVFIAGKYYQKNDLKSKK